MSLSKCGVQKLSADIRTSGAGDPSKPELTLAQCRHIMRYEDAPTMHIMNTNQTEEKQLATINPAQLMKVSTDCAAVCRIVTENVFVVHADEN